MLQRLTISVDAMGGDDAPDMVVAGVAIVHQRFPYVDFLLFGDERKLRPLIDGHRDLASVCRVHHTDEAISNHVKPSVALRTGRNSSMRLAIDAVAKGLAGGVVSAGNTGALMAMAKFVLKTLPGIDRPAITTYFPTERGASVMLDLGGNIDCDADNLVQFAVMGEAFARQILGIEKPSIGLLNVGAEELKGREAVRKASAILQASNLPIHFYGFVEGDDIGAGTVDVVVTDGFTGNIALKTAEGTAKMVVHFLREALQGSWLAKFAVLLARGALKSFKEHIDPRRYNGALFVGLNGICVKSHGGTDAFGFARAIEVAVDLVRRDLNERIKEDLQRLITGQPDVKAAAI